MTKATNEKAPLAGGAFSESQTKSVQRNSSVGHGDSQDPLSKFQLLWLAPMPAPRKLVAMAMAYHSDDDGRNITCSYLTVGTMSGVQHRQVARHVEDLVKTGVLKLERKAVQHHPAQFTLDLTMLNDLALKAALEAAVVVRGGESRTIEKLRKRLKGYPDQSSVTTLSKSRVVTGDHPDVQNASQGGHLRHPDQSSMTTYPPHPSGEGGEAPSGAGLAPVPSGLLGVNVEHWNVWAKRSGWSSAELQRRVEEGEELTASGYDVNAMLLWVLDVAKDPRRATYKRWPDPAPEFKTDRAAPRKRTRSGGKKPLAFEVSTGTLEERRAAYAEVPI